MRARAWAGDRAGVRGRVRARVREACRPHSRPAGRQVGVISSHPLAMHVDGAGVINSYPRGLEGAGRDLGLRELTPRLRR